MEARVGSGIPDVNGAVPGFEFWLELKVCRRKDFDTRGLWRPSQLAFQTKRCKIFPNVWNLIGHEASPCLYLYAGADVLALHTDGPGAASPCLVMQGVRELPLIVDYMGERARA